MIMEAVKGFEHKFSMAISGHSGDTDSLPLVAFDDNALETDVDRLKVLRKMYAHTEVCDSGDSSLASCRKAVQEITSTDGDDYYVFLISDANLEQYGISVATLHPSLRSTKR